MTGLAVLIAALTEWQTIPGYHFNIVVYLAWFSSFTHAVVLLSLDDVLKRSKVLLVLRLVASSAVFVLFVVAQSKASTFGDAVDNIAERDVSIGQVGAYPAQCSAIAQSYDGFALEFRIVVIALAVFGIGLTWFDKTWLAYAGRFKNGDYADALLNIMLILWVIVISALAASLPFGVVASISLRSPGQYPSIQAAANFGEQNSLGFGQLVPVILLVLPFLAAFEGFIGMPPCVILTVDLLT